MGNKVGPGHQQIGSAHRIDHGDTGQEVERMIGQMLQDRFPDCIPVIKSGQSAAVQELCSGSGAFGICRGNQQAVLLDLVKQGSDFPEDQGKHGSHKEQDCDAGSQAGSSGIFMTQFMNSQDAGHAAQCQGEGIHGSPGTGQAHGKEHNQQAENQQHFGCLFFRAENNMLHSTLPLYCTTNVIIIQKPAFISPLYFCPLYL